MPNYDVKISAMLKYDAKKVPTMPKYDAKK